MNATTTAILYTATAPKHHSDERKIYTKSLEDTLLSKIAELKSHLFSYIFDLRNDITLLKEDNDSNNEKKGLLLLHEKINFLESENSFLKGDIIIKHKSSLLRHQCCRVKSEIHQRIVKTKKKKKKEKNLLTKESKDSNRYNTNFTARKQNDNKWSHKSFESDQEKVRNTKTFKKDIITISDSMIKYVNDREILRFSLVTISKDFIDYVRSIA